MIHVGDCLEVMRTLEASSVDAIVTDPPYGLGFMGKAWDHGVPGEPFWVEALRVAKPGAHIVAFGGTRTFHRLACALEDAGWEIRDTLMWVYGSGFPKSLDVSKAIDKAAGAIRVVIGDKLGRPGYHLHGHEGGEAFGVGISSSTPETRAASAQITAPATAAAERWEGWGTALKPAWEPIILARKPLIGTVADNVLAYDTGALNIDGCRVAHVHVEGGTLAQNTHLRGNVRRGRHDDPSSWSLPEGKVPVNAQGRWPANVVHDGSDEVLEAFPVTKSGALMAGHAQGSGMFGRSAGNKVLRDYGDDSGSAARFFYCAKADRSDRDDGCDHIAPTMVHGPSGDGRDIPGSKSEPKSNNHPTVKPTDLMRWLCRLVTPPGGLILDPFAGSGSTGRGAILEGFRFVGIELSDDYAAIAEARIAAALEQRRIDTAQLEMFVGAA